MEFVLGFLIAGAVGLTGVGAGSITAPILILFFHLKPADRGWNRTYFRGGNQVSSTAHLPAAPASELSCSGVAMRRRHSRRGDRNSGAQETERRGSRARNLSLAWNNNHHPVVRQPVSIVATPHSTASADRALWLPPIAAFIGAEVGVSSAGAGALGAVALLSLTKLTPALVVGTDMAFGLIVSTVGSGLHLFIGHYDLSVLLKLCIGGVLGAVLGALLCSRIPSRALQVVLSVCLVGLGLQLCLKALS